MKSGAVVGLDQFQSLFIKTVQGCQATIHVIEHTEFHDFGRRRNASPYNNQRVVLAGPVLVQFGAGSSWCPSERPSRATNFKRDGLPRLRPVRDWALVFYSGFTRQAVSRVCRFRRSATRSVGIFQHLTSAVPAWDVYQRRSCPPTKRTYRSCGAENNLANRQWPLLDALAGFGARTC
jgi:hypothetical protein